MKIRTVSTYVLCGVVGGVAVWVGQTQSFSVHPANVSYPDLIAVLLTGVSILLGAVAVGLAVLALWGWATFKGMTERAAGSAAIGHIKSDEGGGEISQIVERTAVQFLQENLRNGTLLALAEQRNREEDVLTEVDESWGDVEIPEIKDGR